MIATWMLSAIVVTLLLALAGTSIASIAARIGVARRWSWLALMHLSLLLPLLIALRTRPVAPSVGAPTTSVHAIQASSAVSASVPAIILDRVMLLLWAAMSAGLGLAILTAHARALAEVRRCNRRSLFTVNVAVSQDLGPAAVGFIRPQVVLPEWVFGLPSDEQALVLQHEVEHIRAGDQLALLAGVASIVLMPWNLGLWWLLRRLRVAMELDCDARVAPSIMQRPRYAELLLRSRERQGAQRLALALATSHSALGERLIALLDPPAPSARRVTLWVMTAAVSLVAVLFVPIPDLHALIARAPVAVDQPIVRAAQVAPTTTTAPSTAMHLAPATARATMTRSGVRDNSHKAIAVPAAAPTVRYDILVPYVPGQPTMARGGRASMAPIHTKSDSTTR